MHRVEFWSDHVEPPTTVHRNLSVETIEKRMAESLKAASGDADVWAAWQEIDMNVWNERRFCMTKIDGELAFEELDAG